MGKVNRGKDFENVIRKAFEAVPNTFVVRLPDPTNGYLGVRNISDFLIYHYPKLYIIECKSVHGNLLPFSNITDNQWRGMLEASRIDGVVAGVICWWVDHGVTRFIPITMLEAAKRAQYKSFRYDIFDRLLDIRGSIEIAGKKKRVFFDYDMEDFFMKIQKVYIYT
jgi:hypothetical protein